MSDKFRQIENILFAVFLAEYPIVFYLVKYTSFSDYDTQRAALYFLLILTALFAILFAFFCCYDFLFTHPLFIKRAFMLFTVAFLPLFTKYVADNLYYAIYIKPFVYIVMLICTVISSLRLPEGNIEKTPPLNLIGDFFSTIFPFIYYLYKLPQITALGMNNSAFTFSISTIALFGSFYIVLVVNKPFLKNYRTWLNIYNLFCCVLIPPFILYIYKNLLFDKYFNKMLIIVLLTFICGKFFAKHQQKKLNDSQAENHSADDD